MSKYSHFGEWPDMYPLYRPPRNKANPVQGMSRDAFVSVWRNTLDLRKYIKISKPNYSRTIHSRFFPVSSRCNRAAVSLHSRISRVLFLPSLRPGRPLLPAQLEHRGPDRGHPGGGGQRRGVPEQVQAGRAVPGREVTKGIKKALTLKSKNFFG